MTVIAALKFEGGVILAADSQATDDFGNVRWQVEKPFQVASFPCVVCLSGSMGMNDRVKKDVLARTWHSNTFDRRDRVRDAVDASFVNVYKVIEERNRPIPLWGLAAFWAEGAAHILEHEPTGDCSFHDHFQSIGSGAATARAIYRTLGGPLLAAIDEQKAILVVLRILRTCVSVEKMGVSDPFHVWLIKPTGAVRLTDDRVQAELQYVGAWEDRERRAFLNA